MPSPPSPPLSSRDRIASCLVIVLAGTVVYSNTFAVPLLFDDLVRIKDNPSIRTLWPPWVAMSTTSRPLGTFTFALNYALDGYRVEGYHAVNLAIHISAGLLLLGIVRRTFSRGRLAERYGKSAGGLALAIALIWVVHPLQTQAVTYIVQRLESLTGLFYLATLYGFVRAAQSPRKRGWYAASVIACALGMATKEVMVTAPILVLWYDRAFVAISWREILTRRKCFYLALAATWGVLAWSMLHWTEDYSSGNLVSVKGMTPLSYLLSQAGVLVHYLRLGFWPQGQCLDYAWPVARTAGEIVLPGLVILALLGATAWCVFRHREWGFLGGWFFLILAPTSSVVPIVDLAFEHRMYLPLAAVAAAAVVAGYESLEWCLACFHATERTRLWLHVACTLAVAVAMGAATYQRNGVYRSEWSVWNDVVQNAPHNPRAHNHLILILGQQGKLDEGAEHCRKALEADPRFAHAPNSLGLMLFAHGKLDEAIAQYQKALAIDPQYDQALNNLGLALAQQGKADEAAGYFRKATQSNPQFAGAYYNLADLLMSQGKVDEAIAQFQKALEANPRYAQAHNNLGTVFDRQGKLAEAATHYQKALDLDPECVQARDNLAKLRQRRDQLQRAMAPWQQALRAEPQNANAHFRLGVALHEQGQLDEAMACYRKSLEIRPANAEAHFNLATALVARRRAEEAVPHFQQALRIQPAFAAAHYQLGRVFYLEGKADEAIAQWRDAVRLEPDEVPLLNVLAWELATCPRQSVRNGAEAVALAERAVRLGGQSPETLDTLGAAYAEARRFPEAVETARRALVLASAGSDALRVEDLRARIKSYEARAPFRDSKSPLAVSRDRP